MKRLIVCFDGTWNNPEQENNGITAPTNVVKIYNALAHEDDNGIKQLKYYHPGVGGEGIGIKHKVLGGALGVGISRHINSAYFWLGNNYEKGDEIYLFGFSRGAFTVRSLGGMLSLGLLDLSDVNPDESWKRVNKAYEKGYRKKDNNWAEDNWQFFNNGEKTPIHFIGVWDTVGALGVPDDLEILNFFDDKEKWQFHNTTLGDNVKHARHAMAIDEKRSSFTIARWNNAKNHNDVKEIWFPGVHSDVGGGYAECDLSNGALKWMMDESEEKGLCFREGVKETIKENPLGVMHNSFKGFFSKLRSRPRNIPSIIDENESLFHKSVLRRQKISPIEYDEYYPTKTLDIDESIVVDVFARERWNKTNIYFEQGHKYTFSAKGKWQDSKDTCDWKGTENDEFTFDDVVKASSSFLGKFENLFKKLTNNESTDFLGTKRVEDFPWFVLVGAIANDNGSNRPVKNDGTPVPHQYFELPKYTEENNPLTIDLPGYLYCFPNDVWSLYDNNRGSIQLTIKRIL